MALLLTKFKINHSTAQKWGLNSFWQGKLSICGDDSFSSAKTFQR